MVGRESKMLINCCCAVLGGWRGGSMTQISASACHQRSYQRRAITAGRTENSAFCMATRVPALLQVCAAWFNTNNECPLYCTPSQSRPTTGNNVTRYQSVCRPTTMSDTVDAETDTVDRHSCRILMTSSSLLLLLLTSACGQLSLPSSD